MTIPQPSEPATKRETSFGENANTPAPVPQSPRSPNAGGPAHDPTSVCASTAAASGAVPRPIAGIAAAATAMWTPILTAFPNMDTTLPLGEVRKPVPGKATGPRRSHPAKYGLPRLRQRLAARDLAALDARGARVDALLVAAGVGDDVHG